MNTLTKTFLLICSASLLFSCGIMRQPVSTTVPANNDTYQVEYLFEHDGCKVYRFEDRGHYVYFTNCVGDVTSIQKDSTEARVINQIRNISPK
ncbi:MAG: hypothetical protein A2066_01485 [Bacteroidetes bacterium GWB2_41_8]|nr:MAG: hypothetical protein A2066_01485 [Bacteroidetes bacterium GWB2_41_8]